MYKCMSLHLYTFLVLTPNFFFGLILYSDLFVFVSFYFYYSLDVCFLGRDRKGVDLMSREVGRDWEVLGERETIIRIYCMKKYIFNKKKQMIDKRKNFPQD